MKTASVATAKNRLSQLLRRVQQGEIIVITDRRRPIARLQPLGDESRTSPDGLAALCGAGVLSPPAGTPLDVTRFRSARRARLAAGRSLTAAVLQEREETR